jgi:predicted MFS family arabinose efflux permease
VDATNHYLAADRGRWAAAAIFLVNGFLVGSWAPQIPLLLSRLGITETVLGLMILGFGAGALCAMAWCGWLISRFGSRPVVQGFSFAAAFGLLMVVLSPNVAVASLALFLFGGFIGGMDVAMNANAVAVERGLGRAVMSSSHGFWSLGGFAGGAAGGLLIEQFGYLGHAGLVTAVSLAAVSAAARRLVWEDSPPVSERPRFSFPRNPAIYLIGLLALFAMIPEGAVLDWAALHLRQELGTDIATAGFAFAGLSAAMALMRFAGDEVRNRYGAVKTLRVSSVVAATGMLVVGLAPLPWLAIAGFAFAGLGIANIVPIAFSAAGNQDDLSAGAGLSTVTLMGYSGILVAPSAIGFIGERTGFGPVFLAMAVLFAVIGLMGGLVRSADTIRPVAAS